MEPPKPVSKTMALPDNKTKVDLSFLTDKERATILKVIKADLELKKTTLGYLKKAIEVGRQFQLTQKSTEDSRGKCTCCGQVFRTFCDRKNAIQCQQCKHMVCKLCKREQAGSVSCILCVKEKLYTLQSVDYEPVFHKNGVKLDSSDGNEVDGIPNNDLYGSDLLNKSLEETRKKVATEKLDPNPNQRPRASTLPEIKPIDLKNGKPKEERSQSIQPVMTKVPSIDDPNCGFKVIKQASSDEELLDLCSLYSEPCEPEDYDIHGQIKIGVWFRTEEKTLYVRVAKAKGLSAANDDGTSDPYVKVYLLPGLGKLAKRRTTIQRSTTKPEFNEIMKYGGITQEGIKGKSLVVRVSDWDRYGRNQFLGEVRLSLCSMDLTDSTDKWYTLQKMEKSDELSSSGCKGKVLLSLKYEPSEKKTSGKLKVLFKQAEDLKPADMSAQINPFARCYLLPVRLIDSKKKSRVIRDTLNPVWNSEVEYAHVSLEDLESSRALEVTIWDQDRRGVNEFIGGIRLGPDPLVSSDKEWMDSTTDEVSHWEAALARPGEWVEQWHKLRPSMNSLNPNAKKDRKLSAPMYNKGLALSSSSIASALSFDYNSPITRIFGQKSKTMPASTSASSLRRASTDTLKKSLTLKQLPKGKYDISGEILLTVEYKEETLLVHIDRAVKIAAANRNGTSDSYVKIYLLPDQSKHSKKKTEVQKKTTDPVYNTTLKFKLSSDEDFTTRAIWLTVWHRTSKLTNNLFLGEACIPLSTIDLDNPSEQWYILHSFIESGVILPDGSKLGEEDEDAESGDEGEAESGRSTSASYSHSISQSTSPSQQLQPGMIPVITIEDFEETSTNESPEPDLTMSNISQRKDASPEDSIIPVTNTTEVYRT